MMWTPFRKPTSKTHANRRVRRMAASMAAVSLIAAACAADDDSPGEEDPGASAEGTEPPDDASPARTDLVIGQHRNLTNFAANNRGAGRAIVTDQLYNVLIRLYEGDPEPQPELASSWEAAPDGTSITVHLEEGVTFHDGDPFTSEDVAFSLDYVRDPANAASALPMAELITDVETPDDHTVVVNFSQPHPAMLNMFNLIYMLDHRHPDEADAGSGTGPFVLDEFVPDQHVVLTRNEDYWREPAQLETVTVQLLPDPQAKLAQLRAGTVDMITEVPAIEFESFESSEEWVTGATAGNDLYQSFLINTARPPFDDPQVREALSLAVNRERIAAEVVGAGAQAACLPYPDHSLAYFDDLAAQCRFDLDAAQDLLEQAGVSDLSFSIIVAGGNANGARAAEIFQADLATIGVDAAVDQTEGTAYSSNRNEGTFDVAAQLYGGASADPAAFFGSSKAWDPNRNWPQFDSDEYANAVAEAGSTMDEDTRRETYREVSEIILQENFALVTAENPYLWTAASPLADLRFGIEGGYLILEFAHWEN